eukprot:14917349-Alexandrium_andersonii.AAC.1
MHCAPRRRPRVGVWPASEGCGRPSRTCGACSPAAPRPPLRGACADRTYERPGPESPGPARR